MLLAASRGNSLEALHFDSLDNNANRRMRRSAEAASYPKAALFDVTFTKKLRLYGRLPNYLKALPNSSSLTVGAHGADDPQVCFKMHSFHVLVSNTEGGNVVVIESNDGRYITKDSEGITLMAGDAPHQTNNTDDRFFRMYREPGDQFVYLKHLHSGKYLSATESGVSLHSSSDDLPDSTLFKELDCTHT